MNKSKNKIGEMHEQKQEQNWGNARKARTKLVKCMNKSKNKIGEMHEQKQEQNIGQMHEQQR